VTAPRRRLRLRWAGRRYPRAALLATKDGSRIIGVNNPNTTTRIVFVYEVSSATVLRARTVSNVSNVLSISMTARSSWQD
jgi:hypothetical protein